ncbi:uncharacterized protein LOC110756356 isoform X2 [Prunus avium]|uniref:Uncharacterized protein LOC110756356 isoform X2 n=1 Tax=Prunus avium TaxID=42229 RepID=A0A6P5SC51_PRUAV|nr:uncharacterized protein LOC110756356 isoform X2 [Prunus avium]
MGKLDFEEFITLYYLVNSGMVLCDGHGCKVNFLKGLYFTCVDCFNYSKTNTFDLCTSCYRYRNFLHNHTNFLDNHVLMRCKAAYLQDQPSSSDDQADESESDEEPSSPEPYAVKRSVSKRPSSSDDQADESESDDQADESESDEPSSPEPYAVRRSVSKRKVAMKVIRGLNTGVTVGQFVVGAAGLCSIM